MQCGSSAFPLGRGLSQAKICAETGKIVRVVDIAEGPWRVIGLIALPFITLVQKLSQVLRGQPLTLRAATIGEPPFPAEPMVAPESAEFESKLREYELMCVPCPASTTRITQRPLSTAVSLC